MNLLFGDDIREYSGNLEYAPWKGKLIAPASRKWLLSTGPPF